MALDAGSRRSAWLFSMGMAVGASLALFVQLLVSR